MTKSEKQELRVRRAVALADELVPVDRVPEHAYASLWQQVFFAMLAEPADEEGKDEQRNK